VTEAEFARAASDRMEALYRENNGAFQKGGRDPCRAFDETPAAIRREIETAILAFGETWDSEWK
jgi:hypothetical protein